VIYHGVDIVEVARVRDAAERWGARFLRRVFTPGELADCDAGGPAPRFESLAARWAAKEAVAKALGVGLSGLGAGVSAPGAPLHFHEIEVARAPDGRPELRLHGGAADAAAARGIAQLALSLSHTAEHAVASVVGIGGPPLRDGVE
jgi:holo-[acyl-carrier protein] synthase